MHGIQALNLCLFTCLWHNVFHNFKERSQPIAGSEAKRSTAENLGLGMLVKLWVVSVVLCVQQRSLSLSLTSSSAVKPTVCNNFGSHCQLFFFFFSVSEAVFL